MKKSIETMLVQVTQILISLLILSATLSQADTSTAKILKQVAKQDHKSQDACTSEMISDHILDSNGTLTLKSRHQPSEQIPISKQQQGDFKTDASDAAHTGTSLVDPSNAATIGHQNVWISKIFAQNILDFNVTSETDPLCTSHFQIYRQNLRNFTTWAVQMFDSSDLYPSGFFVGDSFKLGNFDGCIDVQIPQRVGFSPQYCLASFEFSRLGMNKITPIEPLGVTDDWEKPAWERIQIKDDSSRVPKDVFKLAFCIPSSCSPADLQSSLQSLLEGPLRDGSYELNVTVEDSACTKNEIVSDSAGTTVVRYYLYGITSFVLICTAVDIFLAVLKPEKHDLTNFSFATASGLQKWLMPFSVARNYLLLFSPSTAPDDFQILHGFKMVFMICVIVGHRVFIGGNFLALPNWRDFETGLHGFSIFWIGLPTVDLFFCITAFLMTQTLIKLFENKTFNFWVHLVNKLFRVLPPYMFVLACTIYILPGLGTGPMWKSLVETEVGYCRENWWTNLLFINNYYNRYDYCFLNSWYMAADMHFFFFGTFLVYMCFRWRSYRVVILGGVLFMTMLMPFVITYREQYPGIGRPYYPEFLMHPRYGQITNFATEFGKMSHIRFSGYIVGIIAAFVSDHLRKKGHKFTKHFKYIRMGLIQTFATASYARSIHSQVQSWVGAFLSIAFVCAVDGYGAVFYWPTRPYNALESAFYMAVHVQLITAGFMALVIIQTTSGLGILDRLFRLHDLFLGGSRLTLWASLLNVPVILYTVGIFRTKQYMSESQMVYGGQYWGDILLIYFLAHYCFFIVDGPMLYIRPIIINIIKRRGAKRPASLKKTE